MIEGLSEIVKQIEPDQCAAVNQILGRSKHQKQYSMLTEFILGDGRDAFTELSAEARTELTALHMKLAGALAEFHPFSKCWNCETAAPCCRVRAA
jgi:hypothetical protein